MERPYRQVKIHRQEMESLLTLKSKLDHEEAGLHYAAKYQKLGWVLQVLNPQDGTVLPVDADAEPETWSKQLWQAGLPEPEINLGVRTGKGSRLMVLEVVKGAGEAILDRYGPWRAACIAVLGGGRERHFYAWQPLPRLDAAASSGAREFRWYGEGQVVSVPPSIETESSESWQWLTPPWETPPRYPSQPMINFLQHYLARETKPQPGVSLSWQEVYCLVSPFAPLLQALAASYPSAQSYYQGILAAAATVGLNSPEVLLSVLWHAPRGNAHQAPDGLSYLEKLVAGAQGAPNPAPGAENVPRILSLDKTRDQARASIAGSPGPARFLNISWAPAPPPGVEVRTPFSCRVSRGNLRKN